MSDQGEYLSLVQPWVVEERESLVETRLFALRQRFCTSPTRPNKAGTFVFLDTADWVNVVAVTPNNELVTIEQFRHGTLEVTLEIPGGMVDSGEAPLDAGVRELREETGYAGTGAELIGRVSPNPAIQNNRCHTVLVRDATRTHETQLDANEEIAVRLVPLAEVPGLLRTGAIHHALVVAALSHFALRGGLRLG